MAGVLLDTHTLCWLVAGREDIPDEALTAITEGQIAWGLYVSPISAWELGTAALKPAHRRPDFGDLRPGRWFREASVALDAKLVPIRQRIAEEAALVAGETGHRDPGDCFLIATARVKSLTLATRDRVIRNIARAKPGYLSVIDC